MTIQEIWAIKEALSDKLWGKTTEEINDIIMPNAEKMKRQIDELRKAKNTKESA